MSLEKGPRNANEERYTRSADADFHERKWKEMAEKEDLRGPLTRYLEKNRPDKTADDFMREEAEMDNAYFDKKYGSEEGRKWEGHLRPMIEAIKNGPDWHGDPEVIKGGTLCISMGGGMLASAAAAQFLGMKHLGIGAEKFKAIIGVSGGFGPAAFEVAGEPEKAVSLFTHECATPEFLNLKRLHKVIDTEVIAREMDEGPKVLDTEAIKKSETGLYAIVRNVDTGEAEIVNAKTATPDIVTVARATSAVPPFRDFAEVNGKKYNDGGFVPVPLKEIIEMFEPERIFVLPNVPFDYKDSLQYNKTERALVWGAARMNEMGSANSLVTLEAQFTTKGRFLEFIEDIEQTYGVDIAFLYPPRSRSGMLENDQTIVTEASLEAVRDTIHAFGGEQPHQIALFEGDKESLPPEEKRLAA